MAKDNRSHIRLIFPDGHEETVRAAEGFSWVPYPEVITHGGRQWKYVGALDGYPYYLREL